MSEKRENWGSKLGFIMAAAGSAVGLGNIWRFPYTAGENGGSAFILIYIGFAFIIGLSVMLAELALGRRTERAAVGAFKKYDSRWGFVGVLGVISAFLIMGFYPVVGGWSLAYVFKSLTGLLSSADYGGVFTTFIKSPVQPLLWMLAFLLLNVVIVARGISGGIEKAGKVLMPTLFGILILLAIKSVSLEGASAGLEFLFKPDFSKVTGQTILAALGQAFFSLSLGMGCMITYGSYLGKSEKLPSNALIVTTLDTVVAILAGIVIFPALFAFGVAPTEGPGLVFVILPSVFAHMGNIGVLVSAVFFITLVVAALTSSVSLLEVVVSYLIDQKNMKRKNAVFLSSSIMVVTGILSSLSLGKDSPLKLFNTPIFDWFDILTDKIFLAIGGLLLAVFIGWVVNKQDLKDEITNKGNVPFALFELWHFLVKWIIPVAIVIVAVMGILSIKEKGIMVVGIGTIVALGVFSFATGKKNTQ